MKYINYSLLVKAMRINKSRQQLRDLEVVGYPHIKDQARKDTHKKLYRQAFPVVQEERILTMGDLSMQMKGRF